MKFTRKASAKWLGTGKEGFGNLTTASKVLNATQYSYSSRFEEGKGTNPEELIAAAHAGCFTMQLSFLLGKAGFTPTSLNTEAILTFEDGSVANIHLELHGAVESIDVEQFNDIAEEARQICPISKLLNTSITLSANLVSTPKSQ